MLFTLFLHDTAHFWSLEGLRKTQDVVKQHISFLCHMMIIVYIPKWLDS